MVVKISKKKLVSCNGGDAKTEFLRKLIFMMTHQKNGWACLENGPAAYNIWLKVLKVQKVFKKSVFIKIYLHFNVKDVIVSYF